MRDNQAGAAGDYLIQRLLDQALRLGIDRGDGARPAARQEPGQHVEGVWKNSSVGVCLIGDFSRTPPKAGQFELLVQLVNALQETCRVPADHVYLLSDIDPRSPSPGAAFPAAKLSRRLLRPL